MYIISRTYCNRKWRSVPLFILATVFLALTLKFNALGWLVPFGIFAVSGVLVVKYANYIPILHHDSENRTLTAVTRKRRVVIPMEEVFNISQGVSVASYETVMLSLIGLTGSSSIHSYYLKTAHNQLFGKNIKFRIHSEDTECLDNYLRLRGEIIRMRSQRAKEIVANREAAR